MADGAQLDQPKDTPKPKRKTGRAALIPEINLTPSELQFLSRWLGGTTSVQAHREAYPDTALNDNARRQEAKHILNSPRARAYIDKWHADVTKSAKVTVEEIIADATRVLRRDIRRIFNEDGSMLPIVEWDADIASCLQSITWGEFGPTVRFEPKAQARDQLAKILGAYERDNEQKGKGEGAPPPTNKTAAELMQEIVHRSAKLGFRVLPFTRPAKERPTRKAS